MGIITSDGSEDPCAPRSSHDVTIVIPVGSRGGSLDECLRRLAISRPLRSMGQVEVIVVDDASGDRRDRLAARWGEEFFDLVVLRHGSRRGLGTAARTGVMVARGRHVFVSDPALPIDLGELQPLVETLESGVSVIVPSRGLSGARLDREPGWPQRICEWVLGLFARAFLRPGVRDTLAGLIGFRRHAARAIAQRARCGGPTFTAEWVALAQLFGLEVVETAAHWARPQSGPAVTAVVPSVLELARLGRRLATKEDWKPLSPSEALGDTTFVKFDLTSLRRRSAEGRRAPGAGAGGMAPPRVGARRSAPRGPG